MCYHVSNQETKGKPKMSGSIFGNTLKVMTYGESHGPAIGCVIDNVPSGIDLTEEDFVYYMDKRKPQRNTDTPRKESDTVKIMSGVFEGKTTGTPIALMIVNENVHSSDYDNIKELYRPGHADYSFDAKFGIRDHRGGGRSSGRETAVRVAAGVIARKITERIGISITSEYSPIPDIPELDSMGGTVKVTAKNVPAGLGEPVFCKLDAELAKSFMSVGAVKAVEIGDGTKVSSALGSTNNDEFINNNGLITTKTNHAGGILGGISNGNDIIITASIKPVPSILLPQKTVDKNGNACEMKIKGRHDKYLPPRIAPVLEAMTALTLADAVLTNMTSRIEYIDRIYLD